MQLVTQTINRREIDLEPTRSRVRDGPWLAAQSYGPADGALFFGRESDATAITEFVRARPLAALVAPSGVGKTSLLHARVIPLLERCGLLVAYARPGADPLASICDALIGQLLPAPATEVDVGRGLLAASPTDGGMSLLEAVEWYARLPERRKAEYRLFAPPDLSRRSEPLPMLSRALYQSISIENLIEYYEAITLYGAPLGLRPTTPVEALVGFLDEPETTEFWMGWRNRLNEIGSLEATLQCIIGKWLPLRTRFYGVFVVADQFEEVFTLLGPRAAVELFETVDRIIAPGRSRGTGSEDKASLPFHLLLSLRKEFYADLVPFLKPFGYSDRLSWFLGPLRYRNARAAVVRPAQAFGIEFRDSAVDRLLGFAEENGDGSSSAVDDIRADLRRFSPALISLIGAHLWERLRGSRGEHPTLSNEELEMLVPGLEDVFVRFLADSLTRFELSMAEGSQDGEPTGPRADRVDALELLDRLSTNSGYRNIVTEERLLDDLPIRKVEGRRLLNILDLRLRLVRRESRRGGRFVEIMHERLIVPVRHMLAEERRRNRYRAALQPAWEMLNGLPEELIVTRDPLPAHFRDSLQVHLDRLDLDNHGAKLLLRSLLANDPPQEGPEWLGWSRQILSLAAVLDCPTVEPSSRPRGLTGSATLLRSVKTISAATSVFVLRELVSAVLSTRSGAAPGLIWKLFCKVSREVSVREE